MTIDLSKAGIGPYQLGRVLADDGPMGVVHEATEGASGQHLAVRILPERSTLLRADPLPRMRDAGLAASQLRHANVLAFVDAARHERRAYVATEFVDGEPLASHVARAGKLPMLQGLALAAQLLSALQAAHDRGLVHGALHPGHLRVSRCGALKLDGLGWAAAARSGTRPGLFDAVAYWAPEQVRGESHGAPADLYAAALIAHELMAGRAPGSAARGCRVPSRELPAALQAVFDRAFALLPRARHASADDLLHALHGAAGRPTWLKGDAPVLRRAAPRLEDVPVPVPVQMAAKTPVQMPPTPAIAEARGRSFNEPAAASHAPVSKMTAPQVQEQSREPQATAAMPVGGTLGADVSTQTRAPAALGKDVWTQTPVPTALQEDVSTGTPASVALGENVSAQTRAPAVLREVVSTKARSSVAPGENVSVETPVSVALGADVSAEPRAPAALGSDVFAKTPVPATPAAEVCAQPPAAPAIEPRVQHPEELRSDRHVPPPAMTAPQPPEPIEPAAVASPDAREPVPASEAVLPTTELGPAAVPARSPQPKAPGTTPRRPSHARGTRPWRRAALAACAAVLLAGAYVVHQTYPAQPRAPAQAKEALDVSVVDAAAGESLVTENKAARGAAPVQLAAPAVSPVPAAPVSAPAAVTHTTGRSRARAPDPELVEQERATPAHKASKPTAPRTSDRVPEDRAVTTRPNPPRPTQVARASRRAAPDLACAQEFAVARELCQAVRCATPEFQRHPVCVRIQADRRASDAQREWLGGN